MIRDLLHSRALMAAFGCLAVVGLMVASVGLVQAGMTGGQEEQEEQENEKAFRGRYRAMIERVMAHAKQALHANQSRITHQLATAKQALERARLHGVRERLHLVQEDLPHRLRIRGPRVEILRGGRGWRGRGSSVHSILAQAEELELTDDQEARIRDAQKAARRAEIARDAEIEVAELDLEDLMEDEYTADLGAVEAKMREISNLRVAARVADLRLRQESHGVLTPEQREKLEDHANVWIYRHGEGPSAFMFRSDDDGFLFEPHEMFERFEFDGDFPFQLFEWKDKDDQDEEQDQDDDQDQDEEQEGASQRSSRAKGKGIKT